MAIGIRNMRWQEIEEVYDLLTKNWVKEKDSRDSLLEELHDMFSTATYRPTFLVAVDDEDDFKVVACSAWNWSWFNYDNFEFFWMYVDPEYRGRGLGKRMYEARVEAVLNHKRQGKPLFIWLSTHLPERYQKFGHVPVLTAPGTIDTDKDTVVMVRRID